MADDYCAALDMLENMIAASSNFQTLVGAANPTEAKTSIEMFNNRSGSYPICVLWVEEPATMHQPALSVWVERGILGFSFEDVVPSDELGDDGEVTNYEATVKTFGAKFAPVVTDVMALANTGGYLAVRAPHITSPDGPQVEPHDKQASDEQRIIGIEHHLHWGVE